VSTPGEALVSLEEVLAATGYNPHALAEGAAGLVSDARTRGLRIVHDWANRPAVSTSDAATLFRRLKAPAPERPPEPEPSSTRQWGGLIAGWLAHPSLDAIRAAANKPGAGG
jgi:hypothetical protein